MAIMFWCLVLLTGIVLTTRAYQHIAQENAGHRLPIVFGEFAVRPSTTALRQRRLAVAVTFLGAGGAAQTLYEMGHWGAAAYGVVAMLLVVNAVPALVVSAVHNRGIAAAPA
ncbi:hypothetical protein CH263_20215 [Rhodococcus sp. 06-1059B-a]|nr:hypothetical protein [Rhodococcus sp. 06-1059B-a]OZD60817.1 hypothetical protein CH263_20215 [Rhodococcus sp. 06-1059B-a]